MNKASKDLDSDGEGYNDIICGGLKCIIIKDDKSAQRLGSGSQLRLWKNDTSRDLWIDRYDVRNDLDTIQMKQLLYTAPTVSAVSGPQEYMLDEEETFYFEDLVLERFQDLLDFMESDLLTQKPLQLMNVSDNGDDNQSDTEEYREDRVDDVTTNQAVSWGYQSTREEIWVRPERDDYPLPEEWTIPTELKLPMKKKQFDVIIHTVKNIRQKGSQFEIFLKLKQSDTNPFFDFLNFDCDLNSLYHYVKSLSNDIFFAGLDG